MNDSNIPDGYVKLPATEVWRRGLRIVILGIPSDSEDELEGHDCDRMGCGTVGPHVIGIASWLCGDPIPTEAAQ